MITLEQIRLLESKVHKAVATMAALREENTSLRAKLDQYEKRISELEGLVSAFKEDQAEIEQGIVTALEKLDEIEDSVDQGSESRRDYTAGTEEDLVDIESSPDADASGDFESDDASVEDEGEEEDAPGPTEGELDIF